MLPMMGLEHALQLLRCHLGVDALLELDPQPRHREERRRPRAACRRRRSPATRRRRRGCRWPARHARPACARRRCDSGYGTAACSRRSQDALHARRDGPGEGARSCASRPWGCRWCPRCTSACTVRRRRAPGCPSARCGRRCPPSRRVVVRAPAAARCHGRPAGMPGFISRPVVELCRRTLDLAVLEDLAHRVRRPASGTAAPRRNQPSRSPGRPSANGPCSSTAAPCASPGRSPGSQVRGHAPHLAICGPGVLAHRRRHRLGQRDAWRRSSPVVEALQCQRVRRTVGHDRLIWWWRKGNGPGRGRRLPSAPRTQRVSLNARRCSRRGARIRRREPHFRQAAAQRCFVKAARAAAASSCGILARAALTSTSSAWACGATSGPPPRADSGPSSARGPIAGPAHAALHVGGQLAACTSTWWRTLATAAPAPAPQSAAPSASLLTPNSACSKAASARRRRRGLGDRRLVVVGGGGTAPPCRLLEQPAECATQASTPSADRRGPSARRCRAARSQIGASSGACGNTAQPHLEGDRGGDLAGAEVGDRLLHALHPARQAVERRALTALSTFCRRPGVRLDQARAPSGRRLPRPAAARA